MTIRDDELTFEGIGPDSHTLLKGAANQLGATQLPHNLPLNSDGNPLSDYYRARLESQKDPT